QFQYDINFYLLSQVGAKVGATYQTNGTPPFVTWRVENPDASTNTFNRVRITETRGTDVKVYDSTYTAATGSWKLDYPGGLREDEWTTTTGNSGTTLYGLGGSFPAYTRTVAVATRVPGGADQLKVKR